MTKHEITDRHANMQPTSTSLWFKGPANTSTPCCYADRIITGSDLLTLRRSCVRCGLQPLAPPTPECLTSEESLQRRSARPWSKTQQLRQRKHLEMEERGEMTDYHQLMRPILNYDKYLDIVCYS